MFCEGLLTPPNYLRRDPSNVTGDTEARHTAQTAAGLRHEEAVQPTRILVGIVAVTTFVTHKHPFLANFTYTPKWASWALARFGYVVCIGMCGMIHHRRALGTTSSDKRYVVCIGMCGMI